MGPVPVDPSGLKLASIESVHFVSYSTLESTGNVSDYSVFVRINHYPAELPRSGMSISVHIGQIIGKIMLTLFFSVRYNSWPFSAPAQPGYAVAQEETHGQDLLSYGEKQSGS